MKRILIALLALLLCTSVLLTGCVTPEDKGPDKDKNPDPQPKPEVNKETVIQSFNKIDLYAMYKAVEKGVDEVANMEELQGLNPQAFEQQISGKLTMNEHSADILVTLKDGLLHAQLVDTTPGADAREEIYVYITEAFEFITFELGADGKWAPEQYGEELDPVLPGYPENEDVYDDEANYPSTGYAMTRDTASGVGFGSLSELLGFDAEILKRITIPEIADGQLTEKDGKLVLDNSYFADVAVANYDFLLELLGAEGAPTKEELRAEIEEGIAYLGLNVAFTANAQTITGVYVTLSPEDAEATIVFEIELSDNGKALKRLKAGVSVETEYDYNNGGYIELTTVLDGDDIKGAKIVAEINAADYNYKRYTDDNDGNGSINEYEVVCSTYRLEIEAKGFAEGENFEISATLDTTVDKVLEIKERYDYDTYETTILSKKEIDKEGHGQEIEAELLIALNKAQKKLDISFELVVDEMELNAEGTWFLTIAPNAGEVPAEITEYINSLN